MSEFVDRFVAFLFLHFEVYLHIEQCRAPSSKPQGKYFNRDLDFYGLFYPLKQTGSAIFALKSLGSITGSRGIICISNAKVSRFTCVAKFMLIKQHKISKIHIKHDGNPRWRRSYALKYHDKLYYEQMCKAL